MHLHLRKLTVIPSIQLVQHFEIKSVPTVYMFVNGQAVDGFAGEQTTDVINEFIKNIYPTLH